MPNLRLSLLLRDSRYIEKTLSKCTRKMAWILITQDDYFLLVRKDESLFLLFKVYQCNFLSRVNNQLVKNQESIEFKLYRERYPFERCCVLFTTFKFVILIEFSLNFARTLYMNLSLILSRIKLISTSFCACI